jgi:hypothetical protein
VNTPFPALCERPLKVLDHVGYINVRSFDADLFQGLIKNLARRSDERVTEPVLLIARLFTDHHDLGFGRSFSKDGLSGKFVEVAGLTVPGCETQGVDGGFCGDKDFQCISG